MDHSARDKRPPHLQFGLELERARREAGLKPKELASKLYLDPRTVRRYLNGERLPSLETTEMWEQACEIEPGRLNRMHPQRGPHLVAADKPGSAIVPAAGGVREATHRPRWRRWALAAAAAAGMFMLAAAVLSGDSKSELEQTVERAKRLEKTYAQRAGGSARTWGDYRIAGGKQGPAIDQQQTVRVTCRIRGFKVSSGNAWWYLVASAPWRNEFFATGDAFFNQRRTEGVDFRKTRFVDPRVPLCP